MDRDVVYGVTGDVMHGWIANRLMDQPKRFPWQEMRDRAWVVVTSAVVPVAALAWNLGASPAATWTLAAIMAVAGGWLVRVLGREYGLEFHARAVRSASAHWKTAALRLIPARHRPRTGTTVLSIASIIPQRTRGARPRRQNPRG